MIAHDAVEDIDAARRIGDLDTPVALVEVARLERNLARMARRVHDAGSAALRPHAKTHKTAAIGRRQIDHGAIGLTVAKVGEAEAFVAHGFTDLTIAYPIVGRQKLERLRALPEQVTVRFAIDSKEGAEAASAVFAGSGRTPHVLIELDSGIGRTGVASAADAVALADRVSDLPGLHLTGVLGYAGGYIPGESERAGLGTGEGQGAVAVADALRAAGHPIDIVSVGSTPTAPHAAGVPGVTEVRPGNYVFYDLMQVSIGTASLDDCALTVLATVVSHPTARRYVLDAGIKALAGEDYGWGTYGRLLDHPEVVLTRATEEHGIIELGEDVADPGFRVGERVRIIPDHACGTANMQDVLVAVDGEQVVDHWPVIARGRVR